MLLGGATGFLLSLACAGAGDQIELHCGGFGRGIGGVDLHAVGFDRGGESRAVTADVVQ